MIDVVKDVPAGKREAELLLAADWVHMHTGQRNEYSADYFRRTDYGSIGWMDCSCA